MKIRPILWTYHKTKNKEYPIKIRVTDTVDGKTKIQYFPIDQTVKKEDWDARAGRVKIDRRVNASEINMKISSTLNQIEKNFLTHGAPAAGNKQSFYWWFEERLKYSKAKHSAYYHKHLNTAMNKLKEYAPVLSINEVNYHFLKNYETYLLGKGNHQNTVADNLTRIRIIVRQILKSGAMPEHKNPFSEIQIRTKKTERKRLTEDQLEKLFNLKFKGHPSVRMAINMYMYSFYNGGIRFGDICRQEWAWHQEGRLRYMMHKSSVEKNIKQHPRITKLLAGLPKKGKYIFDAGVDWKDEDKSINIRNSFYNKKLKLACRWAKIPEVTFHTARHSLADLAVKKKINPVALKGILGHSKIATTEKYMKSFYMEESDAAMDEIFKK